MKRRRMKMPKKKSRRDFAVKSDVHPKNLTQFVSRGGIRL